ncbi:MAG: flagellar M-ring protein FliF, partial [Verrucomicrobiaceae bacterium]
MFESFKNARPQQQAAFVATIALLFAVVLTALWLIFFRVHYQPIFTRLRPADASSIIAELDRRKVPYRLLDGGSTILVAEGEADTARLNVLNSDVALKGAVGFELFNKSDMGVTEFAQKINYQRALQGELERTISTIDGVDTARVHLSMGEDRIFREDRAPPKASVTLRMMNRAMVPSGTVSGVQQLVAAAVAQLNATDVIVLDEGGQVLSANTGASEEAVTLSPAMQEKQAIEDFFAARVRAALDGVYGPEGVDVAVWADLPADRDALPPPAS